jgi:hypothetical protein
MSDLISRQAAIRWVKTECNPYGKPTLDFKSGKKVIEHLKQMPSAQTEVVRCGECKHRAGHMDGYTECDRTERIRIWHPDDWYCAYGKRRKE